MCQKESTVLAHVSRMELVRRAVLLSGNYARGKEFRQEIQVFFAAEKKYLLSLQQFGFPFQVGVKRKVKLSVTCVI
jgi:hypothetical protein